MKSKLQLQIGQKKRHMKNNKLAENNASGTPFFSVCIDLFNREKTIEQVLKSICLQTCKDYEIIIVDSGSTDKSFDIVQKTMKLFPQIKFQLIRQEVKHNEIEGWNAPIEFASGQFIAICEGDDYFSYNHLQEAKRILEKEENIGLYVGGSKLLEFEESYKVIEPKTKIYQLKTFAWCPAPSCIIFPRITKHGEKLIFDTQFIWAAEYSLYMNILTLGYNIVENKSGNFVDRGYRFYLKNHKHIEDMLRVRYSMGLNYNLTEKTLADKRIFQYALHLFIFNIIYFKFNLRLFSIVLKHLKFNLEYLLLLLQTVRQTTMQAIKSRIYPIS